jgi:hypothetical protein
MKYAEKEQGGTSSPFTSKEYAIKTFVQLKLTPFWSKAEGKKKSASEGPQKKPVQDASTDSKSSQKKDSKSSDKDSSRTSSQTKESNKVDVGNVVLGIVSTKGTKGLKESFLVCPTVSSGDDRFYLEPGSDPDLVSIVKASDLEGSFGGLVSNSVASMLRKGHYLPSVYDSRISFAKGIVSLMAQIMVSNLEIGKQKAAQFLEAITNDTALGGLQVKSSEMSDPEVKAVFKTVRELYELLSRYVNQLPPPFQTVGSKPKAKSYDRWADMVLEEEAEAEVTEQMKRFFEEGKLSSEYLGDEQIRTLSECVTAISGELVGQAVDKLLDVTFPIAATNASSSWMKAYTETRISSKQIDMIALKTSSFTAAEVYYNSVYKARSMKEREDVLDNPNPKSMHIFPDYVSSGSSFTTNIRTLESVPWVANDEIFNMAKAVLDSQKSYVKVLEVWLWRQIFEPFSTSLVHRLSYYRILTIPKSEESKRFTSWEEFQQFLTLVDPFRKSIQYSLPGEAFVPYTTKDVAHKVKSTISDREALATHLRALVGLRKKDVEMEAGSSAQQSFQDVYDIEKMKDIQSQILNPDCDVDERAALVDQLFEQFHINVGEETE